jgi:hypothetical protein
VAPAAFGGDYDSWPRQPCELPRVVGPLVPPEAVQPPPEPHPGRIWFTSDYLLWTVRGDPSHFPLVTTDQVPGKLLSGSLASPTVVPLFGGSNIGYPAISGVRLGLGGWFDAQRSIGIDVNGFFLVRRSTTFTAASDNAGNPPLYIPAYNLTLGREDSLIVADAIAGFAGSVAVTTRMSLWGTQIAGLFNVYRGDHWTVNILGGFRYLDMIESLDIATLSTDVTTGVSTLIEDRFQTRNQFAGVALGTQVYYNIGRLTAGVTAQVSLGNTHGVVEVNGTTQAGTATLPSGFFAQASNIGRRTHNTVSAVPELGARLGYRITQGITVFAGYDFLAWNSIARAGDQLDRVLNLTQSPVLGTTGGTLVGPARPEPLFNRTDFLANGLTFGVEWKY